MKQYLVEFLGTMFLMFVILLTSNWLAIGAALSIAILLGGNISAAAFNPAVTLSLYAGNKLPKDEVLPYIISQILGSLAAIFAVRNYVNKD